MDFKIASAEELGALVRAVRKAQGLRQDDAAGSIGVSENFLGKVERGAGRVQWDKLFQVLDGLGIHVVLDVPESAASAVAALATRERLK